MKLLFVLFRAHSLFAIMFLSACAPWLVAPNKTQPSETAVPSRVIISSSVPSLVDGSQTSQASQITPTVAVQFTPDLSTRIGGGPIYAGPFRFETGLYKDPRMKASRSGAPRELQSDRRGVAVYSAWTYEGQAMSGAVDELFGPEPVQGTQQHWNDLQQADAQSPRGGGIVLSANQPVPKATLHALTPVSEFRCMGSVQNSSLLPGHPDSPSFGRKAHSATRCLSWVKPPRARNSCGWRMVLSLFHGQTERCRVPYD